jgi:hypothetical protein
MAGNWGRVKATKVMVTNPRMRKDQSSGVALEEGRGAGSMNEGDYLGPGEEGV